MLKKSLITALVIASSFITPISNAQLSKDIPAQVEKSDKLETYEMAAETRRKAAEIQSEYASKLIGIAEEKKQIYYSDESEGNKIKRFCSAGELEISAGDLRLAASKNYQLSRSNLVYCVDITTNIPKDKLEKIQKQIATDTFYSKDYLKKAIETYLTAANSFSWAYGANPEKEALANEKAAAILEKIAKEKPNQ